MLAGAALTDMWRRHPRLGMSVRDGVITIHAHNSDLVEEVPYTPETDLYLATEAGYVALLERIAAKEAAAA